MNQTPEDIAQDGQNIEAALKGDSAAFRRIVEKYHLYLYNLCWRVTLDKQDAADLTQETFLKLYTHLKDYKPGQKLSNWLYTIALNESRKYLRHKKIVRFFSLSQEEKPIEFPAEGVSADRSVRQAQSRTFLNKLIADLPDQFRPFFVLKYLEELTDEEIAKITGLTTTNVRVRIHRARRFLWEKHGNLIKEYL